MSVVIENLKEAIKGENNAKRKYELYAEQAKKENLPEIAHLFKAVSIAEAIHIKNHTRALQILSKSEINIDDFVEVNEVTLMNNVKNTKSNLLAGINGETYETKQMYKIFMKNSKKEGNDIAELSFSLARKAEKVHARIFSSYLKQLKKNESLEKNKKIFVCQICGNIEFDSPPSICPLCEHTQKFFNEVKP
ncbi:MAG: rubrerythrin family protein [Candidatus Thorarchaeota archaeon]